VRIPKADKALAAPKTLGKKPLRSSALKLATWNVNSIRARIDHVLDWLEAEQPDVLCMQETKVEDDEFPSDELQLLGYAVAMTGTPAYNGVAIASRLPMKEIQIGLIAAPPSSVDQRGPSPALTEPRLIAATVNGVRVMSAYIPNGRSITSPAFAEKLAWLRELCRTLREREAGRDVFLGGDFNVASDERDLYDPEAFRGRVHFHPDERQKLDEIRALGFVDAFRKFDERAGQYSWWDYRAGNFRKNLGLRIDYAFLSPELSKRARGCRMDSAPRHRDKPSDHIPVIVELD
jgi:exodeoxyribonuclease III